MLRDRSGGALRTWDHPLAALEWLDSERPHQRWAGYLGYELGAWLEPAVLRGACKPQDDDAPLFVWGQVDSRDRGQRLPATRAWTSTSGTMTTTPTPPPASNFAREQYLCAVRRCIDYIRDGDVFQVNLSQRLRLAFTGAASELYGALLEQSPARYGALLELDEFAVISSSPELFVRVAAGQISTRPIKGTRPLLPGMERELLESEKDAAELNMIVDLERNDLGRVCEIGTVCVTQRRAIEAHPTVYHGVSTIEGQLRRGVGLVELLRATFPGGSVTGAPKIRAMQIISELEPGPRGAYCGAIGYLEADSLHLNVAIRTMTLDKRAKVLEIPVGGGIVADSDPAAEYEETLVKARAALSAAACATSAQVAR